MKKNDDFSFLFSEENRLIDYEQLFNLDNLYLEFTQNDSIKKLENGSLLFKIEDNTGESFEKTFSKERLAKTGNIISMACRLRDFGYPINSITLTIENGYLQLDYGLNLYQLKKFYNELKRNIYMLKKKYPSDFVNHKDEIFYDNVNHNSNQDESILYQSLLNCFKQYLNSLNEKDSKDLLTSLTFYNSSFFIAINDMLDIENYQEKKGKELWNICSQDPNFRDIIYARYENCKKVLNLPNDYSAESELIHDFGRLVDYSTYDSFMESLKKVVSIIKKHYTKVLLPEDIAVYRGIASDEVDVNYLSKSTFISTSLNFEKASNFAKINNKRYTYLSYITAKKGTPFLMFLTDQARDQKEILFFDDLIKIKKLGTVSQFKSNLKIDGVPMPIIVYEIEAQEYIKEIPDFYDDDNLSR